MLQLSAELDGQQYLSRQAFSVLTAAESAAKLGLSHAATFQPSIVLPGASAQHADVGHIFFAAWEAIRAATWLQLEETPLKLGYLSRGSIALLVAATLTPLSPLDAAGLNHASFAAGQEKQLFPGAPALDLQPEVDHDTAVEQVHPWVVSFSVLGSGV